MVQSGRQQCDFSVEMRENKYIPLEILSVFTNPLQQTNIYLVKVALSVIIEKRGILIEPLCGKDKKKPQKNFKREIDWFMPSAYLKTLKP